MDYFLEYQITFYYITFYFFGNNFLTIFSTNTMILHQNAEYLIFLNIREYNDNYRESEVTGKVLLLCEEQQLIKFYMHIYIKKSYSMIGMTNVF